MKELNTKIQHESMYTINRYNRWVEKAIEDEDLIKELKEMNAAQIDDAFRDELSFGTGGLRGIIGAGSNRMNIYTVARASQGLSNYLQNNDNPSVVIGYDSRMKSDTFAKAAAGVFASNGVRVYFWSELLPVSMVSFAVRYLHASAGVMITASHNPSQYNGYKVYGADGCQITTEAATKILSEIEKVDCFDVAINKAPFVEYIHDSVITAFLTEVKKQSVLFGDEINKDVNIVYSPLNGTGLKPVTRILRECGYANITVVEEQKQPDGSFPTCPYPNPEIRETMDLGIEYCRKTKADLFLATDPDCDRCGIAVKDGEDYRLLSGNEVGLLLLDYICSQRIKHKQMPEDPVFIKTIVTMDLAERIAEHYGVRTINVLTGFKYIGEQIGILEEKGHESSYICGFEESYGYLTGSYVRDKDAVNAAFMISEMFAFYKTRGICLLDRLEQIWQEYGYCLTRLYSYEFGGSGGMARMQEIMAEFRRGVESIGGMAVEKVLDYSQGIDSLPKSDVLKYFLKENCSVVVRPSGTEPKLKLYISIMARGSDEGRLKEELIVHDIENVICI